METIAVQLTGKGVGAIAVILLAGARARDILRAMAGERGAGVKVGQSVHVGLKDPASGDILDDVVVLGVGEERFELHLHGGVAVVEEVLQALGCGGARLARADEAPQVFGGGLQSDVMIGLPLAQTMTAARLVAAQGETGLRRWAEEWRQALAGATANDLWRLHSACQWVLSRSRTLMRMLAPARAAIVGPPNAGKSTLANALLGRPISITSDMAGTTRDWVDAQALFVAGEAEAPVTLVDTAGVRETEDLLERESIERSHQQATRATVVLLVLDGSRAPTAEERRLLKAFAARRALVVVNKIDAGEDGLRAIRAISPQAIAVSAKSHEGLEGLMRAVLARLDLCTASLDEPFAFCARQTGILAALALTGDAAHAQELLRQLLHG